MKKLLLGLAIILVLLAGVICFTPMGESVLGLGFFVVESGRYLKKERALTEEIRSWPPSKFKDLAVTCAQLASARPSQERGARSLEEMQAGVPIPSELLHLKPQRVWIDSDSVTIELMHMMDSDVTLTAEKDKQGVWRIVGHFGDYMNKPEVLFPRNEMSNPESCVRPERSGAVNTTHVEQAREDRRR